MMGGPIDLRRNALRPGGAHSTRDPVASGTWYTPSQARPTLVTLQIAADSVGSGDSALFDIDIRDRDDNILSGYPVTLELTRSGLVAGSESVSDVLMFQVGAGFDYRVTDNSTGIGSSAIHAIEDQL